MEFGIKIYKEYLNFASGHFLIFGDGTREPLHGHNYRVKLEGESSDLDANDMVFDFLDIKPIVRRVCDSLDHKVLIPKNNPRLKIEESDGQVTTTCGPIHPRFRTPNSTVRDTSKFSFPSDDVLLLPIENTSSERLAAYICDQIREIVLKEYSFSFTRLAVEVEETPGQSAFYTFQA